MQGNFDVIKDSNSQVKLFENCSKKVSESQKAFEKEQNTSADADTTRSVQRFMSLTTRVLLAAAVLFHIMMARSAQRREKATM